MPRKLLCDRPTFLEVTKTYLTWSAKGLGSEAPEWSHHYLPAGTILSVDEDGIIVTVVDGPFAGRQFALWHNGPLRPVSALHMLARQSE